MNTDYILSVVNTTKSQLFGTTNPNVPMSWGISRMIATTYNDMPTLAFHVQARLFEGNVLIALNEGADYYEIYLDDMKEIRCLAKDVSFDEMTNLIDVEIERGTDPAEYDRFCGQQVFCL